MHFCSPHPDAAAAAAAASRFHTLPGGLKAGVQLQVGVAVEMLLGMVLNVVVLYASGEGLGAGPQHKLQDGHRAHAYHMCVPQPALLAAAPPRQCNY
jgi:hypothetical protein